jgi:acyl carrier protein
VAENMLQHIVFNEIASHAKCQPDDISAITRLDELGVDSLGAITILYELEDKLDIEVPNEVFDSLQTVGDILIQLDQLIAKKDLA